MREREGEERGGEAVMIMTIGKWDFKRVWKYYTCSTQKHSPLPGVEEMKSVFGTASCEETHASFLSFAPSCTNIHVCTRTSAVSCSHTQTCIQYTQPTALLRD